jgi:hypothetical protein
MLPSGSSAASQAPRCDERSRSQWRDRAGFSPASLHRPFRGESIRAASARRVIPCGGARGRRRHPRRLGRGRGRGAAARERDAGRRHDAVGQPLGDPPGRHVLQLRALRAFHANTGFLGLPFTAALLGRDALPAAITYDQLVSTPWLLVVAFSIGARHRDERHAREHDLLAFLTRNPALFALVAGLLAPDALAPDWAVDAANVLVVALAPLGFFALGVYATAGAEGTRFPPPLTAPVAAAGVVKLTVPVAVVAGCAALIHDVPDAFLVQAAMPTGLNSLLLVAAYRLDRAIISGAIVYSTLAVLAWGLVASAVS